jgi:hypothetical protein
MPETYRCVERVLPNDTSELEEVFGATRSTVHRAVRRAGTRATGPADASMSARHRLEVQRARQ